MKRTARTIVVVVAFAALALTLSACLAFKPGSLQTAQPGGIGMVDIDFIVCDGIRGASNCAPEETTGEGQGMIALYVPVGLSGLPTDFNATSSQGGPQLAFHRDQGVSTAIEKQFGSPGPEFEAIGYLSEVVAVTNGEENEWPVHFSVGLPAAADGGSFAGPLSYFLVTGSREVGPGLAADRPYECEVPASSADSYCGVSAEGEFPVSDLRITPPAEASAFAGATVDLPFSLDFASSAETPPSSIALGATTSLSGATATPVEPSFPTGPLDPTSKRLGGQRAVKVIVPAKAAAGTYDVQLTGTAPTGGAATAVAKLTVKQAKIGIKAKLNRAKGTATLTISVPAAGALVVSGKGIAKVKRNPPAAKKLKVVVKAKGKSKRKLNANGKVRVSAKVQFTPTGAAPVTKKKKLTLKKAVQSRR